MGRTIKLILYYFAYQFAVAHSGNVRIHNMEML